MLELTGMKRREAKRIGSDGTETMGWVLCGLQRKSSDRQERIQWQRKRGRNMKLHHSLTVVAAIEITIRFVGDVLS